MSTRSLTRVHNGDLNAPVLVSMYRQSDGYFSGIGNELQEWLSQYKLCNGIGFVDDKQLYANGMGCLAALMVSYFKGDNVGSVYITNEDDEQSYNYDIFYTGDYYKNRGKDAVLHLIGVNSDGEKKTFRLYDDQDIPEQQTIATFRYPNRSGNMEYRRIGVVETDADYIKGLDIDNDNAFRCFRLDKIVGGISYETIDKEV